VKSSSTSVTVTVKCCKRTRVFIVISNVGRSHSAENTLGKMVIDEKVYKTAKSRVFTALRNQNICVERGICYVPTFVRVS